MISYNNNEYSLEEFKQQSQQMFKKFTDDKRKNYLEFWDFCKKLECGGFNFNV